MSISALIPLHHKEDVNVYLKARSILIGIACIALLQWIMAFSFLFIQSDWVELAMNLSASIYALVCIFLIKYFKSVESYLNAVLSGFYIFIFTCIVIQGGLLSDGIFWLAILLLVNILYTERNYTMFWAAVVIGFIGLISFLTSRGLMFEPPKYDNTYRTLNLVGFGSAFFIAACTISSLSKKSNKSQQQQIGRLKKLHDKKQDQIDVIMHDLKSPSNRILGLIQILDRTNLRQEQLEVIELIKMTNDASNNIINSILGPARKSKEEYNLGLLLNDLRKTYQMEASAKDISLDLDVEEEHVLSVDKFQLIRILDNLITNAIKFSKIGGEVKISAYSADNVVKILVSDSGPGFLESDRELLFNKSAKLSAKPTGNEASHGLGLYIVDKLSKEIGIQVDLIESSAMGSTFEVSISC